MNNNPLTGGNAEVELLRFAISAAEIGTWNLDPINESVLWDKRCRELYGVDTDAPIEYAGVIDLIHPEDREMIKAAVQVALTSADGQYDVRFRTQWQPGKSIVWLHCKGKAYFNSENVLARFSGIAMDVTKEMAAQQKVVVAENLTQAAVKGTGVGIFQIDLVNDIIDYTPAFSQILLGEQVIGLTREDFIKSIYPDDRAEREAAYKRAEETGDLFYETRNVWRDGSLHWMRAIGSYTYDKAGTPVNFTGTIQDITETKQRDVELMAAQVRFRTMVEQAPSAIALLESAEMRVATANKAMLQLWGMDDSIAGLPLLEALPQLKGEVFMEQLCNVYETGIPFYGYNTASILDNRERDGEHFFDVAYTPLRDNADRVTGVMIMATEVTEQVIARNAILESEAKFRGLIDEAPFATALYAGIGLVVETANPAMINLWGKDDSVIGMQLEKALPELDGQPFIQILKDIFTTGEAYHAEDARVDLVVNGKLQTGYYNFTYKPLKDKQGQVYAILNMAVDVTSQVQARKALEASESKFRNLVQSAPIAIGIFMGRDLIIEEPNQTFIDIVGKGDTIIGLPLREAMPELITEGQPFLKVLDDVFTTGVTFQTYGTQVKIVQNGVLTHNYYDFTYSPLYNADGEVYAILDIAVDVTDRVLADRKIEESRMQLLSSFEQAPVAIATIDKDNLIFRSANPFYGELVGRKPEDIVGKSLLEALPELEGQGFDVLLNTVLETQIAYVAKEVSVNLVRNNEMETLYVDLTYQPMRDVQKHVSGILVVATDVTQQVLARKQIEEAESFSRGAIELAELGTWTLDLTKRRLDYSPRLRSWFGFDEDEVITIDDAFAVIREDDRVLVSDSMAKAIDPLLRSNYDVEYHVINKKSERQYIVHAQGRAFFTEEGVAFKVVGTAQDVTEQREIQMALEQEVQIRTEELQATNEELGSTNEELAEANERLIHSNEELAQYAYVASHDLQEPLRKIRLFAGMLGSKKGDVSDAKPLIGKINQSAERMTMLINDLLEFSRLLKSEVLMRPVSLKDTANAVVNDFELMIEEKKAVVEISDMPVVEGVSLQMNQLFYNLLSNALKFTKPDGQPRISIWAEEISNKEAGEYINKPFRFSKYYRITFTDNGIGFEVQYSEQIFEVFKRLHGRDMYPGSGIGLALCRRIVANHSGHLYAVSTPGEGTTFNIIIPDKQSDMQTELPNGFVWTDN